MIEYRRAARADIDAFLKIRMEFVTNICCSNNSPQFWDRSRRYFEEHIDRFSLTYTPDGLHLYEKLGFVPVKEQMQLKL